MDLALLKWVGRLSLVPLLACVVKVPHDDLDGASISAGSTAEATTATSTGEATTSTGGPASTSTTGTPDTSPTSGTDASSSTTYDATDTEDGPADPPDPPPIEPTPCDGPATPLDATAHAQVLVPDQPECGEGGTACWDGPPAGSLYVHLSSQAYTCADNFQKPDCGHWQVSFIIEPEYQVPGLYHLRGPAIYGRTQLSGPDDGLGQCTSLSEGLIATLEILAADDTGVQGRLCHVDSPTLAEAGVDIAGSFFAARCE